MHRTCLTALRIPHCFNRSLHKKSRFQPILQDPSPQIQCQINCQTQSPNQQINSTELVRKSQSKLESETHLLYLQNSIIAKLKQLDYLNDNFYDIHILYEKDKLIPNLSEIDKHILSLSKELAPDYSHTNKILASNYIYNDDFQPSQSLKYKYDLINNTNSISEVNTLISFVNRIAQNHYINYNLMIKRFLKNRIVYAKNLHPLLHENKELVYILMNYFLKNYKYSHLSIVKYLISLTGSWDTHMINIYLKHTLNYAHDLQQSLEFIDQALLKCINNNIPLNPTTLFLIYKKINTVEIENNHISHLKTQNFFKLSDYIHELFLNHNLNKTQHFTNLVYDKLSLSFQKLQNVQVIDTQMKNSLISDCLKSIALMPLNLPAHRSVTYYHQIINKGKFTINSIKKLYLHTACKSLFAFNKLLDCMLVSNQWRSAWNSTILVYKTLDQYTKDDLMLHTLRKELLKENSDLKYTSFGKLFNFDRESLLFQINNYFSNKLVSYLTDSCNWQLVIRSINDLQKLNKSANVSPSLNGYMIEQVLRKLYQVDLNNETFLSRSGFLIVSKYVLNVYLSNPYSYFKFSYKLINDLQSKIDQLYETQIAFTPTFNNSMSKKIDSVRAEYVSNNNFNVDSLLSSTFKENITQKTIEYEGTEEVLSSQTILDHESFSPNLLKLTSFERKLFTNISQLYVLDSIDKVKAENKLYFKQWHDLGIKESDVLKNYHLGFINTNYKKNNIKWVNRKILDDKEKISEINNESNDAKGFEDKLLDEIKSIKLNQIDSQLQNDLTELMDSSCNYKTMERKYSKSLSEEKFVVINPSESTIHNVKPNAWLKFVINKTLSDEITNKVSK